MSDRQPIDEARILRLKEASRDYNKKLSRRGRSTPPVLRAGTIVDAALARDLNRHPTLRRALARHGLTVQKVRGEHKLVQTSKSGTHVVSKVDGRTILGRRADDDPDDFPPVIITVDESKDAATVRRRAQAKKIAEVAVARPRPKTTPKPTGGHVRASDIERDLVAVALAEAVGEGRLTEAEHEIRVEKLLASQTIGELRDLISDLPLEVAAPASRKITVNGNQEIDPARVARVIGFCALGTTALSGCLGVAAVVISILN